MIITFLSDEFLNLEGYIIVIRGLILFFLSRHMYLLCL